MRLLAQVQAPEIDYKLLSPVFALVGGCVVVMMVGLLRSPFVRQTLVPALTAVSILIAVGLTIWIWDPGDTDPIIEGALAMDTLTLGLSMLFYVAGLVAILLSLRADATRVAGQGEYYSLLLGSITGMVVLAGAENLITLFIGIELLSIPLYVLCATELYKRESLESGLKYLVIGSVGSATLLYGLALVYGATGSMQFDGIASALGGDELSATDPLLLTGIALTITGLAFKASVAPFHQWTPDVYQGAPTPITTFMAVATKAAAFAIMLRLFGHALALSQLEWAPALAVLAATTIVIGNVGAIAQRSLKRMLAWSSIAQAGYLLAGVVVGTNLGVQATAFYLAVYLLMNVTAFAVVVARERVSGQGDDLAGLENLGQSNPWLAWPMTIAMLSLAGFPATGGFIGKFFLIDASVDGDYTWLGIAIVVGSILSLVYYLRVIAAMWMGRYEIELPSVPPRRVKPVSGWSPEADTRAQPEVAAVAIVFAAATILFGLWPDPLFDVAGDVGSALGPCASFGIPLIGQVLNPAPQVQDGSLTTGPLRCRVSHRGRTEHEREPGPNPDRDRRAARRQDRLQAGRHRAELRDARRDERARGGTPEGEGPGARRPGRPDAPERPLLPRDLLRDPARRRGRRPDERAPEGARGQLLPRGLGSQAPLCLA